MKDKEKTREQLIRELTELRQQAAEWETGETGSERVQTVLHSGGIHLPSLIQSIPDIIYKLDIEGNIIYVSDAVRGYGYSPEELVGTPVLELVHPEDREKAQLRINERRTGDRRTQALEVRLFTKDLRIVPFELNSQGGIDEPRFLIHAEGLYGSRDSKPDTWQGTQGVALTGRRIRKTEGILSR